MGAVNFQILFKPDYMIDWLLSNIQWIKVHDTHGYVLKDMNIYTAIITLYWIFTARVSARLGDLPFKHSPDPVCGPQYSDPEEVWQNAGLWLHAEEGYRWEG